MCESGVSKYFVVLIFYAREKGIKEMKFVSAFVTFLYIEVGLCQLSFCSRSVQKVFLLVHVLVCM